MRVLDETEMSVAAGGVDPLPFPEVQPDIVPCETVAYWVRMLFMEPETCDYPSHDNSCH